MKVATVTEAKNQLSSLLKLVRGGETVTIVDRGVPVAQLGPPAAIGAEGRLARLAQIGAVRPAAAASPVDLIATPPPGALDARVLEALLEERREGR